MTEKFDYKAEHAKYHGGTYRNEHWDYMVRAKHDPQAKAEWKKNKKEFAAKYHMPRYPFMADLFDFAEEDRAEPNSRTPFSAKIRVEKNVVYKTVDGEDIVMDIYYPENQRDKAPLVMDIPGGGWMIHNRPRREGYARLYAALGAVVAVIDHRLCPKIFFPENLHDCIDAYNYLVDNAEKYNIDPNNITVTGDSSGGHMTACLGCAATTEGYTESLGLPAVKTKPANLIFISGAFSFEVMYRIPFTHSFIVRYFSGKKSRREFREWEFYKLSMPYYNITSEYPESYSNGGMTDLLCFGEAKRMAKVLTRAGVKNEYKVGKDPFQSSHCYVLRIPFIPARKDMLRIMTWYTERQKEKGVDLSEGYGKVKYFLQHYRQEIRKPLEQ